MRGKPAISKLAYVAVGVVIGLSLVGLSRVRLMQIASQEDREAAEKTVAEALVAIRDGDEGTIMELLHSDSRDRRLFAKHRSQVKRVMDYRRSRYNLAGRSDAQIRSSVQALPRVRRALVFDIVQSTLGDVHPVSPKHLRPVAVKYWIEGTPMVSFVVCSEGEWKLCEMPMTWSTVILKYHSLGEAIRSEDSPCMW
jgi:hypothetical protein